MLRTLIGCFCLALSACLLAAGYVEPTSGDLEKGVTAAGAAMEQADKMTSNKDFLDNIIREQRMLEQVPNRPGVNTGVDLNRLIQESKETDFLSRALAGGQQAMQDMSSSHGTTSPMVLVSFSMPEEAIRALVEEAHSIGGAVVLRGMVNDNLPDTMERMYAMAEGGKGGGIAIDPTVFRRYNIDSVPAFVLPLKPLEPCSNDGCPESPAVVAKGTATLRYFLELVERSTQGTSKRVAAEWLDKYGSAK